MDNLTVKNFTNIDEEDFDGMYGGKPISIRRGQTKAFPEKIAKHIAGQLVFKILTRAGKDYITDPKREVLINQMLGDVEVSVEAEPEEIKEEIVEKEEEFSELKTKKRKTKK